MSTLSRARTVFCPSAIAILVGLISLCFAASGTGAQTVTPAAGRSLAQPDAVQSLNLGSQPLVGNASEDQKRSAIEAFDISPAVFVGNAGQWDPSIRYAFQGKGINVLFTDEGPVFELFGRKEAGADIAEEDAVTKDVVRARFRGSNQVSPEALFASGAHMNYYVGSDQSKWRSGVPSFYKLCYRNIYDGIDLYIWGRRSGLKYEFHVAPGADWRQIVVQYEGVETLHVDAAGALHVVTALGEMVDNAPVVYQDTPQGRRDVAARFRVTGPSSYGFDLAGDYDSSLPLILDPELAWSTYLGGGGGRDSARGVAVDVSGNVYVAGAAGASNWVSGGFDTSRQNQDGFVVKLTPAGGHVWSTYLGGNADDSSHSIAVDASGDVFVAGETDSAGWVSGGFDASYGGSDDGFVAKLTSSGTLAWATYLGGSRQDYAYGIAADTSGNAYVAGATRSEGWVSGGFDASYGGSWRRFCRETHVLRRPRLVHVPRRKQPGLRLRHCRGRLRGCIRRGSDVLRRLGLGRLQHDSTAATTTMVSP